MLAKFELCVQTDWDQDLAPASAAKCTTLQKLKGSCQSKLQVVPGGGPTMSAQFPVRYVHVHQINFYTRCLAAKHATVVTTLPKYSGLVAIDTW